MCVCVCVCVCVCEFVISLQDLHNFVGSQDCVNPRSFRVLINQGPKPTNLLFDSKKLCDAGFGRYTSIVVENISRDESPEPSLPDPVSSKMSCKCMFIIICNNIEL